MSNSHDEYGCAFCLTVIECLDGCPPDICEACHVTQCVCGTFIKGDSPKFCYGCGKVAPDAKAHFIRTSSIAAAYSSEAWAKRNLGRYSDGPYYASTSIASGKARRQLTKIIDNNSVVVRDFTPEEIEKLK